MFYTAYEYDTTKADKCGVEVLIPDYFSGSMCGTEDYLYYHARKDGRNIVKYVIRSIGKKDVVYTYRRQIGE